MRAHKLIVALAIIIAEITLSGCSLAYRYDSYSQDLPTNIDPNRARPKYVTAEHF
jgi:hypothetical protein